MSYVTVKCVFRRVLGMVELCCGSVEGVWIQGSRPLLASDRSVGAFKPFYDSPTITTQLRPKHDSAVTAVFSYSYYCLGINYECINTNVSRASFTSAAGCPSVLCQVAFPRAKKSTNKRGSFFGRRGRANEEDTASITVQFSLRWALQPCMGDLSCGRVSHVSASRLVFLPRSDAVAL